MANGSAGNTCRAGCSSLTASQTKPDGSEPPRSGGANHSRGWRAAAFCGPKPPGTAQSWSAPQRGAVIRLPPEAFRALQGAFHHTRHPGDCGLRPSPPARNLGIAVAMTSQRFVGNRKSVSEGAFAKLRAGSASPPLTGKQKRTYTSQILAGHTRRFSPAGAPMLSHNKKPHAQHDAS
jgi:hypothetical protein